MLKYEEEMISYYNTCGEKGYNQLKYTSYNNVIKENLFKNIKKQKCAKVDVYNNIIEIYTSYHEAAAKNFNDADNNASKVRAVCKGKSFSINNLIFRDLDENNNIINYELQTRKRRKALYAINVDTFEEFYYDSILQASQKTGIERARIQKCISGSSRYSIIHNLVFRELDIYGNIIEIDSCPTIEEKIEEYNKRNPIINGIRHNIPTWSKLYNIKTQTVNSRIRKGWDVIKAITTPLGERR